jgi:hypothetical protein
MLDKLKAKKAEIARLREERGATDPILIIAGIAITLILLVGGSFAISGFIANANNLNAKGDLDRIATAQAAFLAERDSYAGEGVGTYTQATALTALSGSSIGFTPTAGNPIRLFASPSGWVAMTKSASGTKYVRTSASTTITESVPGTLPTGINAANVATAFGAL